MGWAKSGVNQVLARKDLGVLEVQLHQVRSLSPSLVSSLEALWHSWGRGTRRRGGRRGPWLSVQFLTQVLQRQCPNTKPSCLHQQVNFKT